MSIKVKSGGAYADIVGAFVKQGGTYGAASVFAKVAGAYQAVGGGGPAPIPEYDPVSLFANGEDGMFYDSQRIDTLFQDVAGTVPITADGQLVARINDRSGNGFHLTQSNAANQYVFKEVDGVRWLDSGGRACIYDSGKKVTGGLTYGVALRMAQISASFELFDSGAGSTSAVNSVYLRHGNTDQRFLHVDRGASTASTRVFGFNPGDGIGRHFAAVTRMPATAGNTNFLSSPNFGTGDITARLLNNLTSGTGIRLGPFSAANVRWYGAVFIQRVISDEEREALINWLVQIGETETPYIWMGDTQ